MKMRAFKPHDLATIQLPTSKRRRVVEVMSHPFPRDGNLDSDGLVRLALLYDSVMVRMVPGDPCTLREVPIADLETGRFGKRAYCHVAEVRSPFPFPEDMLRYDGAALYDPDLHEEGEVDERFQAARSLAESLADEFGGVVCASESLPRRGIRVSEATDLDLSGLCIREGVKHEFDFGNQSCKHCGTLRYNPQPRILVYRVNDHQKPDWTIARWASFNCTIKHLHTKKLGDN